MNKKETLKLGNEITRFDKEMEELASEVWIIPDYGKKIKEIDDYKHNLFDETMKKFNTKHIYGIPHKEFVGMWREIGKKFYPFWQKLHCDIQVRKVCCDSARISGRIYDMSELIWKIKTYLHYHYGGLIETDKYK